MLAQIVQESRLAGRNLSRHIRRSLLALLTISFGVTCYLLAGGFIHWVLEKTRDAAIYSQLGHLQITRPAYFQVGIADPYNHLLPDDASFIEDIELADAISTISSRLVFTGLLSKDERTISFAGEGIDPEKEAPLALAINIIEGVNLTESGSSSAILGKGLAANAEIKPGDTIVLLATTADGSFNAVELSVAGLFASTVKAYDDVTLRVPLEIAQSLVRVEGATSVAVLLSETWQTQKVVDILQGVLDPSDFEVTAWWQLAEHYHKTVELFSRQVGVVKSLIAAIVVLSIMNTLSMTVAERTGEIGTAMALGVRSSGILRLFLLEGVMIGVLGGLIGLSVGTALAILISYFGIPMPPAPGMTEGYVGEIWVSARLATDALFLALSATLLASVIPAWRASRLNIVDALRHQR